MSPLPTPKPGILDIKAYVGGKSKAAGVARVMKLSSNESALGPSPRAIEAYKQSAETLHRYPDGNCAALREAIAQVQGLDATRIVCGAGSDELIALLMHSYAGPGDEMLYSEHGFLMYKIYAQGFGVTPVAAPEKSLCLDVDAMLARVSERTKIVFVTNPNNPTGSYISAAELLRLRSKLPSQVLLVIDAAYAEYVTAADYASGLELARDTENCVMLRTFSKIYGLSSLRLGWGYFPTAIADVMNRVRGPFNVSTSAQTAGTSAMLDTEFTARAKAFNTQWLNWLKQELTALKLTVHPSVANFLLVEFPATGKTASGANQFLTERGVIVRETTSYGLPNCLRITIGLEEENRAVIESLRLFLSA
uniref:Histidinol-phosphate aminotransferase n=1 Tax=uncultured bacterium CSL1 TaxID=1091565 RepID=G4WVA3_9BACT|nr:histidinol-phosphate aminotransferase [uncultured bacterium CSL1]